jgi:hypothetical protein
MMKSTNYAALRNIIFFSKNKKKLHNKDFRNLYY